MTKGMSLGKIVGLGVGVIFIIIPEPATTALGLGIVAYTAYQLGWLGKGA